MEQSLVLIKPDGVKRALTGEIVARLEKAGLKIVAMKMVWVDKELVGKHYPESRTELLEGIGQKTLKTYAELGKSVQESLGTVDPIEIGKIVNNWNREALSSGPVVAIVFEGIHAVANIRRLAGFTLPHTAAPGTIRGDYSIDSPALANERQRPVRNLIHASGNLEEAEFEVNLWFKPEEIHSYKRADEDVMF